VTVAACWDGARAKLAGGGAEARRARDTYDTCHALRALLRKQTSHIPLKLFRDLISDGGLTVDPHFLNPRAWGSRAGDWLSRIISLTQELLVSYFSVIAILPGRKCFRGVLKRWVGSRRPEHSVNNPVGVSETPKFWSASLKTWLPTTPEGPETRPRGHFRRSALGKWRSPITTGVSGTRWDNPSGDTSTRAPEDHRI